MSTTSSAPGPSSKATRFIPNKILRRFSGLTGAGAGAQTQAQVPAPPNLDVDENMQDDFSSPSPQAPEPANKDTHLHVNGVRVGGGLSISGVSPAFVTAVAASAAEGGSMVQVGTKRKRDWESKHANDIIGVVVLEVEGADDLPEWPNGMLFCCFGVIFSSWGRVAFFGL
jgi:phosphatidylserine decarboxylase